MVIVPRSVRYRLPTPTLFDDGKPILPDWDLRCCACGYQLTGLTSRRCPECGEAFRPRGTWVANRRSRATEQDRIPRYVYLGLLTGFGLLFLAMAWRQPEVLLPLLIVPPVEAVVFWLKWDPTWPRIVTLSFCAMAALCLWFI